MIPRCPRCGSFMSDGECIDCREKDIKHAQAGCPAVHLPPGIEVAEVRLAYIPGRPQPQSLTLKQATISGLVLPVQEGHCKAIYLLSSRVKLILKASLSGATAAK